MGIARATSAVLLLFLFFTTDGLRAQETEPLTGGLRAQEAETLSGISPAPEEPFNPRPYLRFTEQSPFSALWTWYPPLFILNGIELKNFIRSTTFRRIRETAGDRRAVDAIYIRAMELTSHNTAVALLIATVATFDHYLVGVKVPLLNLFFPLSNESFEDFQARVRNLPAALYADSPAGEAGDRDKLQHFFGSALVTFLFESEGAGERVGNFIEFGEDLAIVGGVLDNRDERSNWHGRQFGAALLDNNMRYPSKFLKVPVANLSAGAPGQTKTMGCR